MTDAEQKLKELREKMAPLLNTGRVEDPEIVCLAAWMQVKENGDKLTTQSSAVLDGSMRNTLYLIASLMGKLAINLAEHESGMDLGTALEHLNMALAEAQRESIEQFCPMCDSKDDCPHDGHCVPGESTLAENRVSILLNPSPDEIRQVMRHMDGDF